MPEYQPDLQQAVDERIKVHVCHYPLDLIEKIEQERDSLRARVSELERERDSRPDGYRSWQAMRDERDTALAAKEKAIQCHDDVPCGACISCLNMKLDESQKRVAELERLPEILRRDMKNQANNYLILIREIEKEIDAALARVEELESKESNYNAGWNDAVNDPKYHAPLQSAQAEVARVESERDALKAQIDAMTSPEAVERAVRVFIPDWDEMIEDCEDYHNGELSDGMIKTRERARAAIAAARGA